MEGHGLEQPDLRLKRLEVVEIGREHEVADRMLPAPVAERNREVRRDDRPNPGPVYSGGVSEEPTRDRSARAG